MDTRIADFLVHCKRLDFRQPVLPPTERAFYQKFNREILLLCRSLPESAQTDSILFLMHYAGIHPGRDLDFFANYYPPIWSILYWLSHENSLPTERLSAGDVANAVTTQSMGMFLHSLDDHLTDGQVPVSPLTLLLRSEAWKIMNGALCNLSESLPQGESTIKRLIDEYYWSNQNSTGLGSLDSYCDLFRKQMAIVVVAPVLLCMKLTGDLHFTRQIETAFGSFGIAWRLLDDLQDIEQDFKAGSESSVYLCLDEALRSEWKAGSSRTRDETQLATMRIVCHLREGSIVDDIKARIYSELQAAASAATACHLTGLAEEFRCLAHPFGDTPKGSGRSQ